MNFIDRDGVEKINMWDGVSNVYIPILSLNDNILN